MVNSVKGEKLLSYQISLIVGDPLFLTPLLEAGKLEEARQASKVVLCSLFAFLLFCLCLLILIFNFNLDLHIFHLGGASTSSLHPQVIVAHVLLPI